MKEKIARAYDILQNLQIQPTRHNVSIISETLSLLEEVYNELASRDTKVNPEPEQTAKLEEIVMDA